MHELFSAFISGYGNVKNIVIGQELTTIDVFFGPHCTQIPGQNTQQICNVSPHNVCHVVPLMGPNQTTTASRCTSYFAFGDTCHSTPHISPATSYPQPQQFSPVQQSCSESILVDTNYFFRVLVTSNRNVLTVLHQNALPEAIVITNRLRMYVIGAQE